MKILQILVFALLVAAIAFAYNPLEVYANLTAGETLNFSTGYLVLDDVSLPVGNSSTSSAIVRAYNGAGALVGQYVIPARDGVAVQVGTRSYWIYCRQAHPGFTLPEKWAELKVYNKVPVTHTTITAGNSISLGSKSLRLADISVAVGPANEYPAIVDIISDGIVVQQVQLTPPLGMLEVRSGLYTYVAFCENTQPGFTLPEKWAEFTVFRYSGLVPKPALSKD